MSSHGHSYAMLGILCGVIASGSFGAPLKSHSVNMCSPDPFVLQTYKTGMCFITSWGVLLLGERFQFSPFGLVSGLLWVSGGVCGIFGIRNAGLALSVGTWSCVTVLISFIWGVAVFGEIVKSIQLTLLGVLLLLGGFLGMAFYSSQEFKDVEDQGEEENETHLSATGTILVLENDFTERLLEEEASDSVDREDITHSRGHAQSEQYSTYEDEVICIWGATLNRRQCGILAAIMDGLLGGSNLVPMHYSAERGLNYVLSFSIGATCVTLLGWLLLLCWKSYTLKSWKSGYEILPSMYVHKIGHLGIFSGTLWSIGNIGEIYAVSIFGQSIGMSIVQSKMIVSGMLGIMWFREICGIKRIIGWIASALLTLMGIFVLSNEHKTS